jgi:hypothetical protein
MAVGDRTEKRLVGPTTLAATNTALGSAVPASRQWTVKQIIFCNTSGTERLIYMAVGTAATVGNRFVSGIPIASGDTIVLDTALVLNATEQFFGYSDTGSVVAVTIVGWEKEV